MSNIDNIVHETKKQLRNSCYQRLLLLNKSWYEHGSIDKIELSYTLLLIQQQVPWFKLLHLMRFEKPEKLLVEYLPAHRQESQLSLSLLILRRLF